MCWNWYVSLTFATIQWIIIGYLLRRNQFLDRYLAFLQVFIAAQETFQFLLWVFAIDEKTTANSCSTFNTFISYILLFLVTSILPIYGLIGAMISRKIDKGTYRFYVIMSYTFLAFCFSIFYEIAAVLYDFIGEDIHCSYIGENGHQAWAYMDIVGLHPPIAIFRTLMWLLLVLVMILFIRPNWPITPIGVYAAISLLISRDVVQQSAEWASLWCWAQFVESLWYLSTYQIAKYMIEIKQIDEDKNCCTKFWLKGTRAHYNEYAVLDNTADEEETDDLFISDQSDTEKDVVDAGQELI